jgi:hypothetical protein
MKLQLSKHKVLLRSNVHTNVCEVIRTGNCSSNLEPGDFVILENITPKYLYSSDLKLDQSLYGKSKQDSRFVVCDESDIVGIFKVQFEIDSIWRNKKYKDFEYKIISSDIDNITVMVINNDSHLGLQVGETTQISKKQLIMLFDLQQEK